jgi:hypothetical protein
VHLIAFGGMCSGWSQEPKETRMIPSVLAKSLFLITFWMSYGRGLKTNGIDIYYGVLRLKLDRSKINKKLGRKIEWVDQKLLRETIKWVKNNLGRKSNRSKIE